MDGVGWRETAFLFCPNIMLFFEREQMVFVEKASAKFFFCWLIKLQHSARSENSDASIS